MVDEIEGYSAVLGDYLRRPGDLWLWQRTLKAGEAGEREMFPGLVVSVLAVLALAAAVGGRRRRGIRSRPGTDEAVTWLYAVILGLAVWMSLGPGPVGPYRLLLDLVPGLNGLRVPTRFIVRRHAGARRAGARAAPRGSCAKLRPRPAALVAAGARARDRPRGHRGANARSKPFDHAQPRRAELNAWIRQGPPAGVLELPVGGIAEAPCDDAALPVQRAAARPAVVNGYSGFDYDLQSFLAEGGLSASRAAR